MNNTLLLLVNNKMTQQTDIFTQYELFPDESSVKKVLTSNGLI